MRSRSWCPSTCAARLREWTSVPSSPCCSQRRILVVETVVRPRRSVVRCGDVTGTVIRASNTASAFRAAWVQICAMTSRRLASNSSSLSRPLPWRSGGVVDVPRSGRRPVLSLWLTSVDRTALAAVRSRSVARGTDLTAMETMRRSTVVVARGARVRLVRLGADASADVDDESVDLGAAGEARGRCRSSALRCVTARWSGRSGRTSSVCRLVLRSQRRRRRPWGRREGPRSGRRLPWSRTRRLGWGAPFRAGRGAGSALIRSGSRWASG